MDSRNRVASCCTNFFSSKQYPNYQTKHNFYSQSILMRCVALLFFSSLLVIFYHNYSYGWDGTNSSIVHVKANVRLRQCKNKYFWRANEMRQIVETFWQHLFLKIVLRRAVRCGFRLCWTFPNMSLIDFIELITPKCITLTRSLENIRFSLTWVCPVATSTPITPPKYYNYQFWTVKRNTLLVIWSIVI